MKRWLWLTLVVLILDQASKWLVLMAIAPHEVIALTPHLHLTLLFNEGAAFGMLAGAAGWQRWFFVALALGMSVFLTLWLLRLQLEERLQAAALALIIGGALGNLIDRLWLGRVIDFIQVYLPFIPLPLFNPWPAFNLADSAISIGVILLLLATWRALPTSPLPQGEGRKE
ncbi:signal peptidase II [Caldichromatium japonicum]|uniref:Lipoprotein signal peptidase n=1 Tax=Caldichromatium japonicum TaxID=2699430 RepID=A0A6G7VBM1_9GAMM|nr:signal peptidase II [Caldichromatium japonicum]QIK37248.1 signal peptidase II [Caldichromatium japonicum]